MSEKCGAESFLIRSQAAEPLPQTSETNSQGFRAMLVSCLRRPRADTRADIIICRSWGHMMVVRVFFFFFFLSFFNALITKLFTK